MYMVCIGKSHSSLTQEVLLWGIFFYIKVYTDQNDHGRSNLLSEICLYSFHLPNSYLKQIYNDFMCNQFNCNPYVSVIHDDIKPLICVTSYYVKNIFFMPHLGQYNVCLIPSSIFFLRSSICPASSFNFLVKVDLRKLESNQL